MPRLVPSARFLKTLGAIARSNPGMARRIQGAAKRFQAGIHHPALNFEKIKGTDYCSIRVSQGERIVLRATDPDTFDLVDVGDHDTIYRRYG